MGLHVPFALTLLAYVYPFFCLFPYICIHFELVDVPNKAVKKKKKKKKKKTTDSTYASFPATALNTACAIS